MKAAFRSYHLQFKKPGGTSRGVLTSKTSYFITIHHNQATGIGECGLLKGLSCDDVPEYEAVLQQVCREIDRYEYWLQEGLIHFPSIRFGLEMALLDFKNGGSKILFPSAFTEGKESIRINGLIWMGSKEEMKKQISAKLDDGYKCLKLKIGAIDFNE
jgi:o-succinylbenzoate synthase